MFDSETLYQKNQLNHCFTSSQITRYMYKRQCVDHYLMFASSEAITEVLEDTYDESLDSEQTDLLLGRQRIYGIEVGSFVPSDKDYEERRLPTGERLHTRLAVKYILSMETARALLLSGNTNPRVIRALDAFDSWVQKQCIADFCVEGECRYSSVAYARYLVSKDAGDSHKRIEVLMNELKEHRDTKGRWNGFPFYYTLLFLLELNTKSAERELEYTLPACERAMKRIKKEDVYSIRKKRILKQAIRSTGQVQLSDIAED